MIADSYIYTWRWDYSTELWTQYNIDICPYCLIPFVQVYLSESFAELCRTVSVVYIRTEHTSWSD